MRQQGSCTDLSNIFSNPTCIIVDTEMLVVVCYILLLVLLHCQKDRLVTWFFFFIFLSLLSAQMLYTKISILGFFFYYRILLIRNFILFPSPVRTARTEDVMYSFVLYVLPWSFV